MDRRQERAALQRIVALLLALAALAARARDRSPAVRVLVLWFLRPAARVARDFVLGAPSPNSPAGADEATRLAQNFRALARALQRQARLDPVRSGGALKTLADTLARSLGLAPPCATLCLSPAAGKNSCPDDTS